MSTSDCVVTIGVEDETLLACNMAGLQIRKIIEMEADAVCVNTRYTADQTIVGDIFCACQELTKRVTKLATERANKPVAKMTEALESMSQEEANAELREFWNYLMHGRNLQEEEDGNTESGTKDISLPKGMSMKDLFENTDSMWEAIQTKKVSICT